MKLRSCFLVPALLSVTAAHAADSLSVDLTPTFEGYETSQGPMPLTVDLDNTGPDAVGTLHLGSGSFQMDYPVELPRGSHKRFIAYPNVDWGGVSATLDTNKGRATRQYAPATTGDPSRQVLLLVGDAPGQMTALRQIPEANLKQRNAVLLQDAYCKPDSAPPRAAGYAGVGAVMLGPGSERLGDDAVQALKLWTLTGGTLVFIGGASSPTLNDPRWADVIPLRNTHSRTLATSSLIGHLGGQVLPGPVSVAAGTPVRGASVQYEQGVPMVVEESVGLGRAIALAFNPLEPPIDHWDGLRNLVERTVKPQEIYRGRMVLAAYARDVAQPSSGYVTMSGPGGGAVPVYESFSDPFSMKLPPASRIATLLGAYFVVVVPLNFLILRKLRRGELAWFTAPIISLGFAGVLFTSAQSLYSAKMSTLTQGLLVAKQGVDEGMFVGDSEMFVPRGGTYDLGLKNVDAVGRMSPNPYGGGYVSTDDSSTLGAIDEGDQVAVPAMPANNLAFREIAFRQRVPAGRWFSIDVRPDGEKLKCTVRNESPYPLLGAKLMLGASEQPIGTLDPGASQTVVGEIERALPGREAPNDLSGITGHYGGVALEGNLGYFRPGPQIGNPVNVLNGVRIAFFAKEVPVQ